jgi:ubiquinone/menaquinone biosynthesis C-methylase UbiE
MNKQAIDLAHDKANQRQLWNRVAAGWEKWWPVQEQGLRQVSDCLLDLAMIRPGDRVLDIGTGIGEPALSASLRVGAEGSVVATDLAPQMLAIARKRAAALGLKNLEFRVMDTEALDFPESSFDAILSRFSLMFLSDVDAALAKILRMLVPHGKFASSVWDAARKVPIIKLAFDLAASMFQLPSKPSETTLAFRLAEGLLEKALTQAGFSNIQTKVLEGSVEFASVGALSQFLGEVNAPLVGMLASQPAEGQAEYWQALAKEAQKFARPDGSIKIANRAICVVGQR